MNLERIPILANPVNILSWKAECRRIVLCLVPTETVEKEVKAATDIFSRIISVIEVNDDKKIELLSKWRSNRTSYLEQSYRKNELQEFLEPKELDVLMLMSQVTDMIQEELKNNIANALINETVKWKSKSKGKVIEEASLGIEVGVPELYLLKELMKVAESEVTNTMAILKTDSLKEILDHMKIVSTKTSMAKGVNLLEKPFETNNEEVNLVDYRNNSKKKYGKKFKSKYNRKKLPRKDQCRKCKGFGHWAAACPTKTEKVNSMNTGGKTNIIKSSVAGEYTDVLIDSGATVSIMNRSFAVERELEIQKLCEPKTVQFASAKHMIVDEAVETFITIGNTNIAWRFILLENFPYKACLGTDFLKENNVRIDFGSTKFEMGKDIVNLGLNTNALILKRDGVEVSPIFVVIADNEEELQTNLNIDLEGTEKNQLENLLKTYTDLFKEKLPKAGQANVLPMKIILAEDGKPSFIRNYNMSEQEATKLEDNVREMLETGAIERTEPHDVMKGWNSPCLLALKKDGTIRFCIDFRALNNLTLKENIPLPKVEEIIHRMLGAKYFSNLDLTSGYWQVPMEENSKKYTVFSSEKEQYNFTAMPFGLTNAPAHFQRIMNGVLSGIKGTHVYLDDIIVYSKTWKEHLEILEQVLKRIQEFGMFLKGSKCHFGKKEIQVLGYRINEKGILPDKSRIESIQKIATPKSSKDVVTFLGIIGYYRKFIKNLTEKENPLRKATVEFTWGTEQQQAFEKLKEELSANTLLHHPKNVPFEVHTDASDIGIGAALVQVENGEEVPIQFYSKKLSETEKNYDTLKKELYAIYSAVKKFRPFLYGRSFRVLTDHKPLIGLLKNKSSEHSPMIGRILSYLSEYNMVVEYKKGENNLDADALSRLIEVNAVIEVGSLMDAQKIDPIMSRIIASKDKKNYFMKDDILYHKEGKLERLVVPGAYILEIIRQYHSTNGMHQSSRRTFEAIARKYFWSGMRKSVEEYCKRCERCVQKKIHFRRM